MCLLYHSCKVLKRKMQFEEINSKFLTPIRGSWWLQDKTSKLANMLKDHFPCVFIGQLTEWGDETNTFICLPNTALYRCTWRLKQQKRKKAMIRSEFLLFLGCFVCFLWIHMSLRSGVGREPKYSRHKSSINIHIIAGIAFWVSES